jgi:hypothetical protein
MNLDHPQVTKRDQLNFADALSLLFIGLKLTDHIGWSWWWVLSPMIIQMSAVAFVLFWKRSRQ